MINTFSNIKVLKTPKLGGLEFKSAIFMNKSFPTHFHNDWSISYITEGSELDKIDDLQIQITAGTIIVTPPNRPHSMMGYDNQYWKYNSLYINSDYIKVLCSKRKIDYSLIANQTYLISNNLKLVSAMKKILFLLKLNIEVEEFVEDFLYRIINENISNGNTPYKLIKINEYIEEMKDEISLNFKTNISLEELSNKFGTNKYNILRQFKKFTGLSPREYAFALRIENAKRMICYNPSITDIAFECGFYDISHFSKTFKRYVGVSPSEYKNNLQYYTSRLEPKQLILK